MSSDSSSSQKTEIDRRVDLRIAARIEVRFKGAEDAARALRSYSLNFSIGGLCLKTQRNYAVGAELELALVVAEEEFRLQGVVAWRRDGAIGVRFVNVTEKEKEGLMRAIQVLSQETQR